MQPSKAFAGPLFLLAAASACLAAFPALCAATEQGRTAEIVSELVAKLSSVDPSTRERAFDGLLNEGDDALEALAAAASSKDPETSRTAKRIAFMIRWRMDRSLEEKIGPLWDGYDDLPPQSRILRIVELGCMKPVDAIPLIRRAAQIDPHPAVRLLALRIIAGMMAQTLTSLNSQGCDLMRTGRFGEAEEKFRKMLEIDASNDTALYNLACSRSLQGMIEDAFDLLRRAVLAGYRDYDHARTDPDLHNLRAADPDRFEKALETPVDTR